MIVGFDGSRAFAPNRTGTENYSYQLLINLAKIDRENNYIIYLRSKEDLPHLRPGNVIEGEWPDNFKFKVLNFKRLWTQVGLALQTFIDPIDVLFTPSHTLPLIRRPNLKTVMTVHDLGAEYLPGLHQLKQRLYLGFITKFQLKTATKLIAVSKATKKDLIAKVGVSPEKIEVIYEALVKSDVMLRRVSLAQQEKSSLSGAERSRSDAQVDIKRQFDINRGKYFLFVGTIQPRKNLARLIEAFSSICHSERVKRVEESNSNQPNLNKIPPRASLSRDDSSLKLVIAGSKGWMSDEIYELPKKLGIEEKVIFTGRVTDNQLDSLYKNALAFVYPSLFEGFGLPILEAYSYNLPVLTSKISSMPEVAGKAAILIDPYDIDDISNGMKKLLDDNIRERQIKLGKEQLKKFSWEKCAKETLELFQKIV